MITVGNGSPEIGGAADAELGWAARTIEVGVIEGCWVGSIVGISVGSWLVLLWLKRMLHRPGCYCFGQGR